MIGTWGGSISQSRKRWKDRSRKWKWTKEWFLIADSKAASTQPLCTYVCFMLFIVSNHWFVFSNILQSIFQWGCNHLTLFAYSPAKLTLPCGRSNSSCVSTMIISKLQSIRLVHRKYNIWTHTILHIFYAFNLSLFNSQVCEKKSSQWILLEKCWKLGIVKVPSNQHTGGVQLSFISCGF